MEEQPEKQKFCIKCIKIVKGPVRFITTGIFGENHTLTHRIIVGSGVMVVGVNIAHVSSMVHIEVIQLSLDGVGYLVHGIGAVPFVDLFKKISDGFK